MSTAAWHGRSMHCIGVIAGHISTMASKKLSASIACGRYRCMIGRPSNPRSLGTGVEELQSCKLDS